MSIPYGTLRDIADELKNIRKILERQSTIEVSEDGEDYLRGYNDGWYAHEVITNAKLHIDKPRGFTLRTDKGYGNYSEDCISRADLRRSLARPLENNNADEMYWKGWHDCTVAVETRIADAPSVVPSREEGEWEVVPRIPLDNYKCSECGAYSGIDFEYCPHCGSKMKGVEE